MGSRRNTKVRLSTISNGDRLQSNGTAEQNMWSSMLESVASGKKLPEKTIIVLGGNPDTQKEFLQTLASDASKRPQDRHKRRPPTANRFALGYTYQDVLDADHEDIIARLSLYLLSEPLPSFGPLLKPLLNQRTVPETLLVILLDWAEPWLWVRQLRDWIRFLRMITSSLDSDTTDTMEKSMKEWQQRRRGGPAYDPNGNGNEGNIIIPLSQGEWDEALGLPLCVVCHSADKIEALEKEHSWREEEFDFVLQFLRTILMKHGASLIYTSISVPNSLPTLIHSTLGIHSLLKRQSLKHNVIDRDKVLVPPNWDSWGKIRVLREGFDVEGISSGWSSDIQLPPQLTSNDDPEPNGGASIVRPESPRQAAVLSTYEETICNPKTVSNSSTLKKETLDTPSLNTQDFLASQLAVLDRLKAEEEKAAQSQSRSTDTDPSLSPSSNTANNSRQPFTFASNPSSQSRISEQIGPVQFNMGGIQVDADDMVRRLKQQAPSESVAGTPEKGASGSRGIATPEREKDGKAQNEALASFFAGLLKRPGGSGTASPKPGAT